jgi:hypothetical protein
MKMLSIVDAEWVGDHRIRLHFSDGKVGVADLGLWLTRTPWKAFHSLRDPERFRRFHVDYTISWENGLDLAPEFLYFLAFRNEPELQELFQKWGYLASDSHAA